MIYAINTLTKEHRLVKCVDENWDDEWEYVRSDGQGWIQHDDRVCPLPDGHQVDVRYRCGDERFWLPANVIEETNDGLDASVSFWKKDQSPYDIIAYRPVFTTEEESEMPEYEIESCYRVVDVNNGVSLMIQSDPDGMDTIHISPSGSASEDHYGNWEFWLSIEQAKMFRDALSRKIADMEVDA